MAPPTISADTRLQMAALIAAVRTARFDGKDFEGMSTPRCSSAIAQSLWLADAIYKRAIHNHPEWFENTGTGH